MSKFNILYWNIHCEDGKGIKEGYIGASEDIVSILNNKETYELEKRYNKKNKLDNVNSIDDIHCIVFTEGYPQKNENNFNTILKERLSKFELYSERFSNNCVHIFVNVAKCNAVQIKNLFPNDDINYPDLTAILIKLKNCSQEPLCLCGARIKNDIKDEAGNKIATGDKQIKNLKDIVTKITDTININKVIIIGDFNPTPKIYNTKVNIDERYFKNIFNSGNYNVKETENGGTNKTSKVDDKTLLQETYPDKIITNIDTDKISFYKLKTTEECYVKKEYINDLTGYLNVHDRLGNEIMRAEKLEGNIRRSIVLNKSINIYINRNIGLKYMNASCCNAPFPDHNLLFASIDLGD